jgi:hypothetical protein
MGQWKRAAALTNAAQKMVGTWKSGPYRTRFSADGTFVHNSQRRKKADRGNWRVQGDRVVQSFSGGGTVTNQILSISGNSLVVRSEDGQTVHLTKVK